MKKITTYRILIAILVISLGAKCIIAAETRNVAASKQNFIVNGQPVNVNGVIIDGYNYLKITEFAELLNIDIAFDETTKTVSMDKTKPFSGARQIKATKGAEFVPVFTHEPIPEHIKELINGKSFKDNTPFDYSKLSYLIITYYNFDGEVCVGEMIVNAAVAEEVMEIFEELYMNRFPINKIELVDYYDANDALVMEANYSSSFNFRFIAGTQKISNHGYGLAIDINPVQNPYVRDGIVEPKSGIEYLDRSNIRKGMIAKGDETYQAFISRGWTWGGDWNEPKDYQHFEKTLNLPK